MISFDGGGLGESGVAGSFIGRCGRRRGPSRDNGSYHEGGVGRPVSPARGHGRRGHG